MRIADAMSRLLWLPIAGLAGAALVLSVMLMDNEPPGTFVPGSGSIEIDTDRLYLSYRFIRHRPCAAVVTRSIIDPVGRMDHLQPMSYIAEQIIDLQAIGRDRITLVLPKPARLLPGTYLLQANIEYSCNMAQEIWPIRVGFSVPYRLVE